MSKLNSVHTSEEALLVGELGDLRYKFDSGRIDFKDTATEVTKWLVKATSYMATKSTIFAEIAKAPESSFSDYHREGQPGTEFCKHPQHDSPCALPCNDCDVECREM